MSKYEFKTISTDQFELHYDKKDGDFIEHKVIPFKRTVEMAKKLQSLDATARFNMLTYLNSIGKTKKDLVVERKTADGKIEIDETNYREFENSFLMEERFKLANDVYKMTLGMDLLTVLQEIGLDNEQGALMFSTKLRMILTGEDIDKQTFPSRVETEQVPTGNIQEPQNNI